VQDGKAADASQCAAAALTRMPSNPEVLFWAIRINGLLASKALQRFEAAAPDAPRTHLLLGDMNLQRARYVEAAQQYQRVLQAERESMAAWQGLAIAYLHDGNVDQAIDCANHVLASEPESPAANQVLGEALVARRMFAEAEIPLRKALLSPQSNAAHLHALLGRAEAGLGRTASAIAELEKGLASDTDGSLHFQLARLYRQTGNTGAARKAEELSQALANQRLQRATIETDDSASVHEAAQPQP
jgi:predicted Zn-dependent protease